MPTDTSIKSPSFDALRTASEATTRGATAKAPATHHSCNVIARLEAPPETQGDALILRATPLFDGPHTATGRMDTFVVRADRIKECKDNLNKGAGGGVGSILALGNAWRDADRGVISVGWINTCISAQKVQGALNHHQNRDVVQVYAQMPVLDFTNVHRGVGEPARIRWALGKDAMTMRVANGSRWTPVVFDRRWLQEKLAQAWEARAQDHVSINLRLPVLRPEQARPARDAAEAAEALDTLLSADRYRSILTRISNGGETETRWQPLMRGEHPGEWIAQLLARVPGFDGQGHPVADPDTGEQVQVDRFALIEGIDNPVLFDAAARGEVQIEFIPRDALLVASKNAVSLANDIKTILQSETADDLHAVAFTFGRETEAVSRVALVLQQQADRTYVVAGPFRLDVGPAYTPATVPSPYGPAPASPAADRDPAAEDEPSWESATVQDLPELADEDFELSQAALDATFQSDSAAAPAPAPAKPPPQTLDAPTATAPSPAPVNPTSVNPTSVNVAPRPPAVPAPTM